ncbi:hypothetical protein [Nonomuraea turkmeniaca]|uniref:hypothetical protein n=1 Tax=Nonomuraea turkmeniaca TaxID=103838 RepID=UPI001476B00D|nr:hypothetical protein [Nonomuraea turkmeniaca]
MQVQGAVVTAALLGTEVWERRVAIREVHLEPAACRHAPNAHNGPTRSPFGDG